MRENKRSDLLMDAIGSIDDRFIFEAQVAQPKKRYAPLKKILAITVCTMLVMSLTVSLFAGLLSQKSEEAPNNEADTNTSDKVDGTATNKSEQDSVAPLADVLREMKAETQSFASHLEREMLFEGETLLIWQYADEENYRICTLSGRDASKIKTALEEKKDFVRADADSDLGELEGFWICFGDGLVYTPYLESSNGNIGYGQLFDYDPELEPSRYFTELITNAIENAN